MKINEKEMTLEDKIIEWKTQYKKIYQNYINDKSYIWRRLTRKEYMDIMSLRVGDTAEDRVLHREIEIVKTVVLNIPIEELEEDIEDLAGLSSSISEEVLEKSGFATSRAIEL